MEFLVGIISSTFIKKHSGPESDELILWLLQQLDKLRTDSLTAGMVKLQKTRVLACIKGTIPCLHILLCSLSQNPIYLKHGFSCSLGRSGPVLLYSPLWSQWLGMASLLMFLNFICSPWPRGSVWCLCELGHSLWAVRFGHAAMHRQLALTPSHPEGTHLSSWRSPEIQLVWVSSRPRLFLLSSAVLVICLTPVILQTMHWGKLEVTLNVWAQI